MRTRPRPEADRSACDPEGAARRRRRQRAVATTSLVALVAGLLVGLVATPATASGQVGQPVSAPVPVPPPQPKPLREPSFPRPVVLLGTAGLRWSDASTSTTPALAALGETWAIGNAAVRSVRTTTCPADGWLAVSAGNRAADLPRDAGCRELTGPVEGQVVAWDDYLQAAEDDPYDATPGQLGDTLAEAEIPVAAIGPGAAVALARTDGTAPEGWSPRPADPAELTGLVSGALRGGARLVVVDLGVVHDDASAAEVDQALRAALAGASAADVLVMSLADRGDEPSLQVAAWGRPQASSPGLLTSASTRQDGTVKGTDVTATLLARLGMGGPERPSWVTGAPIRRQAPGDGVAGLVDAADHADVVRPLVSGFYLGVVVVNIVLFAAVWFGLARPPRRRTDEAQRRRVLRWLQLTGLAVASMPISLLLANLVPWWRAPSPAVALVGVAACIVAGLVTAALAGPWRRAVLGPAALVAAVTAAVVVVDVLTGSKLQTSAVFGSSSLLAGRFYGFNNTTFTLAAVGTLVVVSALVVPLVRSGRRLWAAAVVVVAGTALTIIDGSPSLGADFGGPPALIPAFAVLALLLAGVRLTWRRVVAVLGAATVGTMIFAVVDWASSPDQRTHLGNFVETLVNGDQGAVLRRKAWTNLSVVDNSLPLTLLTIALCAFVVAALVRPVRRMLLSPDGERYAWLSRGTALSRLGQAAPTLVPCLIATATALVIGLLANDSGIVIPALGVAVVVPLLIATCAGWMTGLAPADPHEVVAEEPTPGRSHTFGVRAAAGFGAVRRWVRPPVVVVGLTVIALAVVLVPTLRPSTAPTAAATASERPVVLVGTTGLRWEDVGAFATPALWDLSRDHAVGQVVVRSAGSRACPLDGWLAVSSGTRLASPRPEGHCSTVVDPVGEGTSASVRAWPDIQGAAADQSFSAQPGLFGDTIRSEQVTATAVGPGASVALADSEGVVAGTYHRRPDEATEITPIVTEALESSALVVVDAGTVRDAGYETVAPDSAESAGDSDPLAPPSDEPPGPVLLTQPDRAEQVKAVDERIGAVMAATEGTGATVLVVSLADSGRVSLRLAAVSGALPGTDEPAVGLLTSASTQQPGVVQATDVLPTVLAGLGVPTSSLNLAGATFTTTGPVAVSERMAEVRDISRQSSQIGRVSGTFADRLMTTQVLFMLLGTAALVGAALLARSGAGTPGPRTAAWRDRLRAVDRERVARGALVALRVVAVALAALPVASFLTNLTGWWRSPTPLTTFWSAVAGIVVLIVALAFAGPWRRSTVGPVAVVAGITLVVLLADVVVLGSRLVIDSPLGTSRIVGGRFYGMNNQGFALVTVAGLIVAALIGRALRASGQRLAAMLAVLGLGVLIVAVDGLPSLGADFGGPPALVAGFALLAVAAAGWRVRRVVVLGALGGAVVVTGAFAVIDYLRPPEARTHVGRFVATIVAGGWQAVIGRKLEANLRMLGRFQYTGPVVLGALVTFWLCSPLRRFTRLDALRGRLGGLLRDEPLLAPTAGCVAAALAIGFAVNDSGAVIPAIGLTLAFPALLALAASWLEGQIRDDQPDAPALEEARPAEPTETVAPA